MSGKGSSTQQGMDNPVAFEPKKALILAFPRSLNWIFECLKPPWEIDLVQQDERMPGLKEESPLVRRKRCMSHEQRHWTRSPICTAEDTTPDRPPSENWSSTPEHSIVTRSAGAAQARRHAGTQATPVS
jgi:hypothetical protein